MNLVGIQWFVMGDAGASTGAMLSYGGSELQIDRWDQDVIIYVV